MKMIDVDPFDELFTHAEDATGLQTTYNVTRLYAAIAGVLEEFKIPVEEEHASYCVEKRGVEQDRIQVLYEHPEYLKKPIVFINLPDGTHLLVDGTHRYVVFHMAKAQWIPAYIVPWTVAAPFVVEDVAQTTEADLMQWSGISVIRKLQRES
jgi:hypothetical protein